MRWLLGRKALETIEYIVGGVLILFLTVFSLYQILKSTNSAGGEARTSIDALPAPPSSWP
ncbi:MAG: hypothetical protein QXH03_00095 [Candidatus Bathyarchaeia archaeon]